MTPAGAQPAEYTPIFEWDTRRGRRVSLFSFIAASAALHTLCFYLFQIIYPPIVALLPPPARVSLITADSEEGRLLLRWVEAEDPALSSTTQRPDATGSSLPPEPAHVASYLRRQPALKQLPPYRPDLRIPSAQPPGPVALPRVAPPSPASTVASRLRFAPAADSLGAPQIPDLKFVASSKEPPAAAQFHVGIGAHGAVDYCFLQSSSGDPTLDEQAQRYLLLCRFPDVHTISDDQLLWTTAALEWGNDLTFPAGAPAESPAP
jgi:hypothetical protein